jgi:tripartite motif-containing protein 71
MSPTEQSALAILKFDNDGNFIKGWGFQGTEDGQFEHPHGIAVDSSDNVYVTDQANCNVQKFTKDGDFLDSWPVEVVNEELLFQSKGCGILEGLDIDSNGNVFVAALEKDRIQKFSPDGVSIQSWEVGTPWGVVTDSSGNILVTEQDGVIKHFTNNGKFIEKWGARGNATGQFLHLHDIEVDSKGNMYVADQANTRIHKFSKDGKYIESWGSEGSEEGQFRGPHGIAIDSVDHVHLVDLGNRRIQEFDGEGNFIRVWASKDEGGRIIDPHGMDIDSAGNFYVVDSLNAHER